MRKQMTITTIICDICKAESENCKAVSYPVIFHTDQTEGRPCEPYISSEKIDICEECAKNVLKLRGYGCQGENIYEIGKEEDASVIYAGGN